MRKISIFGATGSVGRKAFNIATRGDFEIVAISGNKNCDELIKQAMMARPKYVCVGCSESFKVVRDALASTGIEVFHGSEINNLAFIEVDVCLMSIAGVPSVSPTFACLGHARRLAIASKEAIIIGGRLLHQQAMLLGTEIIPVDSEHNSIFQALIGECVASVEKIILTASGGPFVDFEENELANVTLQDALAHPNWRMGAAITIDSATLINKAKEIIEATYLFDIGIEKIEPLIHPNSIIHGIVTFRDGMSKAVLSPPDMAYPIASALNYPKRIAHPGSSLDFYSITNLNFRKAKSWQKRNMNLAYQAFHAGKVITFSVANDIAVSRFLNNEIRFQEIYEFVIMALEGLDCEGSARSCEELMSVVFDIEKRLLQQG